MSKRIFTSESVTEGHPDKICDQISDGVLDAILAKDPQARVACECATTTGLVLVMGEITTNCYVDIAGIARDTITKIGYDNAEFGFDGRSCAVLTAIDKQSEDIAMGVDASYDDANQEGAGDQGMMFGFACNETKELMPAPISYAHNLTKALTKARKDGKLSWLRPDGKSQVSVQYGEHGEVERIDTVVVSTQHAADIAISDLREAVIEAEPSVETAGRRHEVPGQSDGKIRHRRSGGRLGSDGTQDHCRYLRRLCGAWRRCVLRQGPDEG